jgi:hypothetical protein
MCVSKHFSRIANYCYHHYAVTQRMINLFMPAALTFLPPYAMPSLRAAKLGLSSAGLSNANVYTTK